MHHADLWIAWLGLGGLLILVAAQGIYIWTLYQ